MLNSPPRPIISRRSRPAKAPLSRDVIVDTALRLLKKNGLTGLSMRKVASALDTGAASLYVYVQDLDELHGLMLDRAIGKVSFPESGNWRMRLRALLISYFQTLHQHPGLAQLALATIPSGPNALRVIEEFLRLMTEGGIKERDASWGVDLFLLFVTAIAAEQSLRTNQEQIFARLTKAMASLSAEEFPLIVGMKDSLLGGGGERFNWAFEVMINGVVQTSREAGRKPL